ncbi:MAG: nucleotidyltransferase family protein, partial [Pseudomonadota bacterium]|nr:nucleotidyltransferase family protein [Pseudomonadota bacterium]
MEKVSKKKSHKSPKTGPKKAMVLAAGLGRRLRPITNKTPKPLVRIADRSLLDHALDRLVVAGVECVVVNIHYLAEQIKQHLASRKDLEVIISSEETSLLETGGGVKKAIANFADEPFFISNADVFWLDGPTSALGRMIEQWDEKKMDALLMLHSTVEAYGYSGVGDFEVDTTGKLSRRLEREITPYLFTGVQIIHPRIFEKSPDGKFSLNLIYDKAIDADRLFGIVHDGEWFHIGTLEGLVEVENYMRQRFSGK